MTDMSTVIDAATNKREQEFHVSQIRWDEYIRGKNGPPALHPDYVREWLANHPIPLSENEQ